MLTKKQVEFRIKLFKGLILLAIPMSMHAVYMQDKGLIALWLFILGWDTLALWALGSLNDRLPEDE